MISLPLLLRLHFLCLLSIPFDLSTMQNVCTGKKLKGKFFGGKVFKFILRDYDLRLMCCFEGAWKKSLKDFRIVKKTQAASCDYWEVFCFEMQKRLFEDYFSQKTFLQSKQSACLANSLILQCFEFSRLCKLLFQLFFISVQFSPKFLQKMFAHFSALNVEELI